MPKRARANDESPENANNKRRKSEKVVEDDEATEEFLVEAIVGERMRRGKKEFKVKWEGFDKSENTWEPLENVSHTDAYKEYIGNESEEIEIVEEESAEEIDEKEKDAHHSEPEGIPDLEDILTQANSLTQAQEEDLEHLNEIISDNQNESSGQIGRIKSVRVVNFMNHEHHKWEFIPETNWISGTNGSGKSAMLAAVMIGLGSTAKQAGRGSQMQDYVRIGTEVSEIEVELHNVGIEARPDFDDVISIRSRLYADRPTVEHFRRKKGASGLNDKLDWKKMKKKELQNLMRALNIHFTNPLVCMIQAMSKKYIKCSDPAATYNNWLEGTSLKQMFEHLDSATAREALMKNTVDRFTEQERGLTQTYNGYVKRYEHIKKMEEADQELIEVLKERFWAIVGDKKREIEEMAAQIQQVVEQVEEWKDEKGENEKQVEEWAKKMADLASEMDASNTKVEQLESELADVEAEEEGHRQEYNELHAKFDTAERERDRRKMAHDEKQRNIRELLYGEEEAKKEAKRAEKEKDVRKKIATLKEERKKLAEVIEKNKAHPEIANELGLLRSEMREMERQIQEWEHYLESKSGTDKIQFCAQPYEAKKVRNRVAQLCRQKKFSQPPRGPIGLEIKVKSENQAPTIESAIGSRLLNSWICASDEDAKLLRRIFSENRYSQQIITQKRVPDRYDVKRNKYDHDRICDIVIADTWIFNTLVDHGSIDRKLYMKDDDAAGSYLRSLDERKARNIIVCTENFRRVSNFGRNNEYMERIRMSMLQSDKRNLFKKLKQQIKENQESIEELKKKWGKQTKQYNSMKDACVQAQRDHRGTAKNMDQLEQTLERLLDEKKEMQLIPETSDGGRLIKKEQNRLKELEKFLQDAVAKYEKAESTFQAKAAVTQACRDRIKKLEEEKKDVENRGGAAEKNWNDFNKNKGLSEQKVRQLFRNLAAADEILEDAKEKLETLKEDLEDAKQKANDATEGEEIETERTEDDVKKEVRVLKKLVDENNQRRAKNNAEDENLPQKIQHAKWKLETFKARTENFCKNYYKFQKHLAKKRKQCERMKLATARSCRSSFQLEMQRRGGRGDLIFNHESNEDDENKRFSIQPTLELDVTLHSQKKGQKYKTTQLSGGEATKTQLCFLMAMFKDSASPFHVLDEIDVYLDHPNRHHLIDQLTKLATNSNMKRQWIFLTPHDTSCIARKSKVKVMTMSPGDP